MKKFLFLVLLSISIFSCSKENFVPNTDSKSIYVEHDYLCFNSQKEFYALLDSLPKEDNDKIDKWENKFTGFISMRKICNNLLTEYNEIEESEENFNNFKRKSESYFAFDKENSFAYKFKLSNWRCFINSNGIVKIEGRFYICYSDRIVIIDDGDLSKLETTKTILMTDTTKKITVCPIYTLKNNERSNINLSGSIENNQKFRLEAKFTFSTTSTPIYNYYYDPITQSSIYIINGYWNSATAEIELESKKKVSILGWIGNSQGMWSTGSINIDGSVEGFSWGSGGSKKKVTFPIIQKNVYSLFPHAFNLVSFTGNNYSTVPLSIILQY